MRRIPTLWLMVPLALLAGRLVSAEPASPSEILKRIEDLRASRLADARKTGHGYDAAAVERDSQEIARNGIAGIDVATVPVADALSWAKVFSGAGKGPETIRLVERFLATTPSPADRFQAELLRLDELANAGNGTQVAVLLATLTAPDDTAASLLTSRVSRRYADVAVQAVGLDSTLALLDKVYAALPVLDAKALAQTRLAADKERRQKNNLPAIEDEAKQLATTELQIRNGWAIRGYFFANKKSDLLVAAGRQADAVKVLDAFIAGLAPELTNARRAANSARKILTLPGTAAPEIKAISSVGEFAGLAALQGKVVVLDFFAHWCGPCKASIPDTRKLLADLQGKGLAVVGVTQYYGYYGTERNLTPAAEEERLHGFVKEHELTWPVVLVDRDVTDAFGVQAIPHVVVVDRKGTIRRIEIGYSAESFTKFRAEIEELLKA